MPSLYDLSKQFTKALEDIDYLIEEGFDVSDDAYADTIEALQMPIEQKVENTIKYIKSIEALAEARKLEAKRLKEIADAELKKADRLKNYISDGLKTAGITNIQAGIFKVSFKKGSEVTVIDEAKLPEWAFVPQEPKPMSKTDLKAMIKNGAEIPGVSLVRNPDSMVVK